MTRIWSVLFWTCAGLCVTTITLTYGWLAAFTAVLGFAAYTLVVLLAAQFLGFNDKDER